MRLSGDRSRDNYIQIKTFLIIFSIVIVVSSSSAGASSFEDFAARLLCESDPECELIITDTNNQRVALVILGIELPSNAARDRAEEQRVLVAQGSYLTVDGDVRSIQDTQEELIVPERGTLRSDDFGSATLSSAAPIIITTPRKDCEQEPK